MNITEVLRQMRDPEADNERLLWADAIEAEIEQMQKEIEHCRKAANSMQKALREADRMLEQAAQLNPGVMAAHAAIRTALAKENKP